MGYAVVDTETTGFAAETSDRIIEIAIVGLTDDGEQEFAWTTLINPGRDLGPTQIHRIRAEDVVGAPTFAQAAPTIFRLLAGRVFVAHNASFDRRFVVSEFERNNLTIPLATTTTVCTQATAKHLLPGARSLAQCCDEAGITIDTAHEALSDAQATARLAKYYLARGALELWHHAIIANRGLEWPHLAGPTIAPTLRGSGALPDGGFLQLLPERTLHTEPSIAAADAYLALLHTILLDRVISRREVRQIVDAAQQLEISRQGALELHRTYVSRLIAASTSDGVVTPAEVADVQIVAALLGVSDSEIAKLAETARAARGTASTSGSVLAASAPAQIPAQQKASPAFSESPLRAGDRVVFTGQMSLSRSRLEELASDAGLRPHPSVTKTVSLVIAGDPDSLSGKAKSAEKWGIPIVTEEAFLRLVDAILVQQRSFE